MYLKTFLNIISFLLLFNLIQCDENPIVETTLGPISGKILRTLIKNVDYFGFMGIPFAAPPVGELRFMAPQPADPWDETLKATREKPACIQFNNDVKKGQELGWYGVEDCLYLDVFTPAIDEESRPVIVFIYNEHFQNSYNKSKDYAPDFFIEEDVIVVTLSHRLSAFGFLSLENDMVPGNAGLKDIVEGLEWVRDNIKQFGGDPDRVTLMGLEGGAAAIDLLIHTKAKDLFQAAILHSGSSWASTYLQEDVRDRAFKLGELVEKTSTNDVQLLKELQNVPAPDLLTKDVHASPDDYFKQTQKSVVAFSPIVEKQPDGLITEYPEDSMEKIDIPIMIGSNSREALEPMMQYLIEPRYITFLRKDFPLLLPRRLRFRFDPIKDVYDDATKDIRDFYFKNGKINLKSVPDLLTYMGDASVNYVVDYTARLYSERSEKPVYYYYFDYISNLNENKKNLMKYSNTEEGTWGTATGDEMCYLFKCPALADEYLKLEKNVPEEKLVQKKMIKMWTNFVKYGNPTPDNEEDLGLKWPSYTSEKKEYLHIDKQMQIKQDLNKKRYEFWDQFIDKWGAMAVDGVISESINKKDEL
ncbi:juvenile hormone esterase-like [Spodoptera frugiperda]|uniref:Juvenile hormone esterase-like n=1 Tax=Spodoptera frugiperda TaxID=7108 RepID=A0A9R0D0E0_SPOFR|nr:juvenile hormone esterase-like [Spodoptera frugiperda]